MPDPGVIFVSIPVVAIVMGVGSKMLQTWTHHQQEMMRLRAAKLAGPDQAASDRIEALSREIALLRDTTTQYDMSVERALEELRHRLSNVETKVAGQLPTSRTERYPAPLAEPEQPQTERLKLGS